MEEETHLLTTDLETVDQIIACEKFIKSEFQCMIPTGIIKCKYVKGPLVYILQEWVEKTVNMVIPFTMIVLFISLYIYTWRIRVVM